MHLSHCNSTACGQARMLMTVVSIIHKLLLAIREWMCSLQVLVAASLDAPHVHLQLPQPVLVVARQAWEDMVTQTKRSALHATVCQPGIL
jgi:hypothetical protein